MARVFISHSSRDNEAAARMKAWLEAQNFEAPFLDFDKHAGIPPGAEWEKVLYDEIRRSQALLILQTPNWSASRWCFAEFTQARAQGKPVFQVIEDDGGADEAAIAGDLQRLDLRSDREGGLAALRKQLIQIAEQDQGGFPWPPPQDPHRPPFPGLMMFVEEDAAVFFGRDGDWRAVIERLNSRRVQGGARLLVLQGSSGSGKSSLLRAGVLPRLRRAGRQWLLLTPVSPRARPLEALALSWALALGRGSEWRDLHQQLQVAARSESPAALMQGWIKDLQMASSAPDAQILLSIDQGEELFTVAEAEEKQAFLVILCAAMGQPLPLQAVMTIRADAVGELQQVPDLLNRYETLPLAPLPMERYREIIEGPAKVTGLRVEEAFVAQAVRDTETEDALPLLAFALRRLYDKCGTKGGLTLNEYLAMGDATHSLTPLENAVRSQADGVLKACQPSEDEKRALREAFVPAMVRVSEQGSFTRRVAKWKELPPAAYPLLEALVKDRILVKGQDSEGQTTVEVAHEALLRVWPELSEVLKEEQEFVWGIQQLEQDFKLWSNASNQRNVEALLTGLKLSRATTWLEEKKDQLSPELREFIQLSINHANQILRKRSSQRRNVILAGGAMSAMISLSLAELARFESGIFPYSVVTGYVENFLNPAIEKLKEDGLNPVFIVMTPMNYDDLDHKKRVKRYNSQLNQAGYSVKFINVKTQLPRGATIAKIEPQPKHYLEASQTLYIDAASTVTTFKNVINYKKENLLYGFSSKDAMVTKYVDDFKKTVYKLIKDKNDKKRIIFASSQKELLDALRGLNPDT